ncbi:MAG: NAD(+)/NADH kinase [Archaeoglobus sp.]|uniref:NAD(+)/NADH kinase n=1 Tax=Archaeoglobus sp. TaxID=1872626 RepID=UPI001D67CF1B|nr:NAD(+)/NADH kinase [Archaeoglobus sp.]MBO8179417.1 NAD(+)/NADH kinase [Archaeoglobus sp.]
MKAAIVYKTDEILSRVERVLENLNISFGSFSSPSEELENYDFIVSIGGDGTILRILQKIRTCPPIFGINTGRIGLLTHSTPENFEEILKKAVKDFEIEEFPRIECENLLALNEFAILSKQPGKLMDVTIKLDGAEIDRLRCDGIVVATQIGSTGYAFSAGGPVVDPYIDCMIIVPIAPFRFGWKPFVIDMNRKVEISVESALLIADGQKSVEVSGDVEIRRSEHPAVFFKKEFRVSEMFRRVKFIE